MYSPELKRDVFCWTPYQQSMVKGTFYYGYVILQVPSIFTTTYVQYIEHMVEQWRCLYWILFTKTSIGLRTYS